MGARIATAEVERAGLDRQAFVQGLALLVEYFRVPDFTAQQVRIYDFGLRDVPGALVKEAALLATATRTWMPKVVELRADAAVCRQRQLAALPYAPCGVCAETTPGWVAGPDVSGVIRLRRCACWHAWQAAVAAIGPPLPAMLVAHDDREGMTP